MTEPADADRRPDYSINVKVAKVIEDARAVFQFVENDSKYTLFRGDEELDPERPLASYHFGADTLLVLSVQGGNA